MISNEERQVRKVDVFIREDVYLPVYTYIKYSVSTLERHMQNDLKIPKIDHLCSSSVYSFL